MSTGNQLDIVIAGRGFFQVRMPDGQIAYTRDGAFHLNRERNLVTASGDPMEPQIAIPQEGAKITIGQDGTVSVKLPGQSNAQQVGRIEIASFANPAGLDSIGKNLFLPTTASGDPVTGTPSENGLGRLNQGFLEQSNVNIVEEMINLIVSQRAYETSSRVVRAADEMYEQVNNLTR